MKFLRLTLLFSLLALKVLSQSSKGELISITISNATVEQFASEIEGKSAYHFYFRPSDMDSIRITLSVTEKPVESILETAFAGRQIHYALVNKNIFLTKKDEILTTLPPGLIKNTEDNADFNLKSTLLANSDTVNKNNNAVKATLANKLYEIGIKTTNLTGQATLAGYVRDSKSGEPVIGASIFIEGTKTGVSTDQFGYYSLTLPKGRQILYIKGIGMKDAKRQLILYSDGRMNIELQEQVMSLKEVTVSAQKTGNVNRVQMGVEKLSMKTIKQVPTVFGEADVLRVVLTLPGVQSVGEATTGFNVRGGATDQNLILFNDATIYNPAHFFGFFSAFNPDVVKDINLYKSSIPAKYGGRLSSVLDITAREGNKKKFTGTGGLGLLTSRLNIEGPLVKDKTSFILGGRATYSNWLLNLLPDSYKQSKAGFQDLNLNLSHQFNEKNNLYFTGYLSNDRFSLNSDTVYGYSNKNVSLKYKHVFNNKFVGVVTGGYDRYQYNVKSDQNPVNGYSLGFDINQSNFKTDFTYYLNKKNTLDFGLSSNYYKLHPGSYQPFGEGSVVKPDIVEAQQAIESALYLNDNFDISPKLSLNAGIRYSLYNYLGPQQVNLYAPGLPKEENTIIDSTFYNRGDVIKTYHGPEFRLGARYSVKDDFSIKASYNTLRQYLHLLSNTAAIAPTDIWKMSDANIRPQFGDQISLGLYKNFKSNLIETSVEVYYKHLEDYLDYKSGANLVMNHHIETDVINTKGKAYGAEFMIKKSDGKLNGWMSYTYSRTLLKMDDPNGGELINKGNYYPSNFDKPHSANFVGNFKASHRFSLSVNVTYSTGRPITLPIGKYVYGGSQRVLYSDRNAYRIPDYFRTDFSMNIEGNHKIKQLTHNSWTIGIYNVTGRKNAYSTYFTSENGAIYGYKLSIFATAIPFVNYNIRF
ncbi:TonB-dependent receptor [Rubrolithibacter danxiaensis]|uniref:TonB-dependent receptor n=1 Tax=Rubrolithibacter danxiaensis TaxID=3390805 RepID=UPI003BF7756F